jgi:hypothetical protein
MRQFIDTNGAAWQISLTIDAIKRVKCVLGIDLASPQEGTPPTIARLDSDIIFLCDVLYVLLKPQCDAAGIDDVGFAQRLGGETITAAHDALFTELTDFFRQCRREDVVKLIQKQQALVAAVLTMSVARVEALNVDEVLKTAEAAVAASGN